MKKGLLLTCLLLTFSVFATQAQRYFTEEFTSVLEQKGIQYGANMTVITNPPSLQPLVFDLYQPAGDDMTERPLVIYVHTGNFLPTPQNGSVAGSLNDSTLVETCRQLAKRGFVVAAVDYRLGWNPLAGTQAERTNLLINAAYRGVQDVRCSVRFFKRSVEEGNPFAIDTARIAVLGQGTGGYITYGVSTLNDLAKTQIEKFLEVDTDGNVLPMIIPQVSGNVDGLGFPNPIDTNGVEVAPGAFLPLNIPNHVGYNSDVQFCFAMGGAVGDLSWIDSTSVPMAAAHVSNDPFAKFYTDILIVPTTQEEVVEVSGAGHAIPAFNASGANDVLLDQQFIDPYSQRARTYGATLDGLDGEENIMPIQRATPESAPWEWWDVDFWSMIQHPTDPNFPNAPITVNFHQANSTTNTDMSKDKAVAYIDSVVNYFVPRAVVALDLPVNDNIWNTGLEDSPEVSNLSIYPNPATDQVRIASSNDIKGIEVFDVTGKLMKSYANLSGTQFNLNRDGLADGIYILKIETVDQTISRKLILK